MNRKKENGYEPINDERTMDKAVPSTSSHEILSSDQQLSTAFQSSRRGMKRSRFAKIFCSASRKDSRYMELLDADVSRARRFQYLLQCYNLTSDLSDPDTLTLSGSENSNVKSFPRLWGETRREIQIEFPAKTYKPRESRRTKANYDLRERYSEIVTPSDIRNMSEAQVICTLFSHHACYSLQETHPWVEVAKKYAQDISEGLQRGPYQPATKAEIKSRSMVLEEMKKRALQNIIHHDNFNDVKNTLTKGPEKNLQGDITPALLVHNGISFLSGIQEWEDHSFESLTERMWRLARENLERRKKKLHDLEVIFDTEVIFGHKFPEAENVEAVETEINTTDYESSFELAPINKFVETFWAIVKIDIHQDGSKEYEIKKPSKEKPKCHIPETTHRHFVVFADLNEDNQVETKETNCEDKPNVSTAAKEILQTLWAVVKIDLLNDGTKVYEIKAPSTERPNCPIPEATHRHFLVAPPRDAFNKPSPF